jgi:integrase
VGDGIYADEFGLSATVKVHGKQREQRFPRGTSLAFIAAWRQQTRDDLEDDTASPAPTLGTFRDDVTRYLPTITTRRAFKADRSHLRAWLPALGDMMRAKIRAKHVRVAVTTWQHTSVSARTIRHRVRVLRELYRALDGPHALIPTIGVTLPTPPAPHPVAVPWTTIQKVATSLKKGKRHKEGYGDDSVLGYARFLVRATTGQRPSQIMRAQPEDVDLSRKIWFVRPAKGGHPIPLPLDRQMVKAWRVFIKANAWGDFDVNSFSHLLRRHGWPKGIRPYALRSTFAIDLLLGGADLGDVQGFLGHRQIETTRKHYAPVLLARLRRVGQARKGRKLA